MRLHCFRCGYEWKSKRDGNPMACPKCKRKTWNREHITKYVPSTKHGLCNTPMYRSWADMKQRCTNPKSTNYSKYGEKGITVCERWFNSFNAFLEDMGECEKGMQIDRIDNDMGYEPGNCRWVTNKINNRNKSKPLITITYKGETKPLHEWEAITGIPSHILRQRQYTGWSVDKIFGKPVITRNRW